MPQLPKTVPLGWCALILCALHGVIASGQEWASTHITDELDAETSLDANIDNWLRPTSLLQPQPLLFPSQELQAETPLPTAAANVQQFLADRGLPRSLLSRRRSRAMAPSLDVISGLESRIRVTTDAGNLMSNSPTAQGINAQRRTPIVTAPKVRGSRVSRLVASGSYWVPARIDLDTMLSKIDSRIIADMIVIKGPYSVLYGPGFEFVDIALLPAPRYELGFESHGSTSSDYKTNGEQVYGRQEFWGGNVDWGYRVGYGHRTGNDYFSGNGTDIPSSYNSRDIDVALGYDLTDDSYVEFSYLRLDQTGVEYPGQAFDMSFLLTDAYEVEYVMLDQPRFDRFTVDAWYNRTRFDGNAQGSGKRRQFPIYDAIDFVGFTDVDSTSTGFRTDMSWGDASTSQLTAGVDFRYVKQELNEITSGQIGVVMWNQANSPIPRSFTANPGLFSEITHSPTDRIVITGGVRGDYVSADVTDDPSTLAALGTESPQHSLDEILGTDQFAQNFALWSAYVTSEFAINPCWQIRTGFGYAERPPDLTEFYATQPFMFLLQNGLNTVTGDPRLDAERRLQFDLGFDCDQGGLRYGAQGFYAWVFDYITFENTRTFLPPTGIAEQVNLKFVNTEMATLAGCELYAEYDLTEWVTPFATMQYIEGRDQARNGDFATRPATGGAPSVRVPGLPRGWFSGVPGGKEEPLPGMPPLESRLGIRIHPVNGCSHWSFEVSARVVDNQDRVAVSLLETPTPGFTVWDIRGYWQPSDALLIVAGVENFTDKNYGEHFDYRARNGIQMFQPGVNFYFGAELLY